MSKLLGAVHGTVVLGIVDRLCLNFAWIERIERPAVIRAAMSMPKEVGCSKWMQEVSDADSDRSVLTPFCWPDPVGCYLMQHEWTES